MKIIKIGRSSRNDVNIDDPLVSRLHCQIIQEDNGNFSLIDNNSRNGTFINGTKRHGEIRLNQSDIIRIGNTTLPWQTYFNDKTIGVRNGGTAICPEDINIVKIGRRPTNDIVINDRFVSNDHCQIIKDANGLTIVDTNSKNGTYVNGVKVHGSIRLKQTDIVRIGNTTLPWQKYFPQLTDGGGVDIVDPDHTQDTPDNPNPTTQQFGLGTIALILSIIGVGLLIYCAVNIMRWGIFAFLGSTATYIWISVGINIIAIILASVANYNNHKDSNAADIAEWISGFCIFAVIAFYLWIKFGDTSSLNPFSGLIK